MLDQSSNNRRIAKNTIALYFRTFITMIVGLFTSRVLLQALGSENYGIQNVVGGIVAMSAILTGTTSQAISRFLTCEIGISSKKRLKTVFSTSVSVQFILAVVIVILLEIFGVWFLETQANIPEDRMSAARWVLQCSVISTLISIVYAPYQAVIIAHERMSIYAYFSIVDVLMKLGICYLVLSFGGDKLIVYASLLTTVSILTASFYVLYCGKKFEESRYKMNLLDMELLKEITNFSGWNLLGNTAWMLNTQGINMLINVFFGVVFNAARGIAITVSGAITSFVENFTTAFTPQIIKSYASGNKQYSFTLANQGTKCTCLLMSYFIVPVFLESHMVLKLWLGSPPEYSDIFLRFALFESMAVIFGSNLLKVIQATGDIKKYEIEVTLYGFLAFPITWICFKAGLPVWTSCLSFIIIYFSRIFIELKTLKRLADYPIMSFISDVVIRVVSVLISAFIFPYFLMRILDESIFRLILVFLSSTIWITILIFIFGLDGKEKKLMQEQIKKTINRIVKNENFKYKKN